MEKKQCILHTQMKDKISRKRTTPPPPHSIHWKCCEIFGLNKLNKVKGQERKKEGVFSKT